MGLLLFPFRADGLSLRPFFDHSIGGLDLQWGIANGYLVDIHAYAVRTATDIAALPTRMQASIFCCGTAAAAATPKPYCYSWCCCSTSYHSPTRDEAPVYPQAGSPLISIAALQLCGRASRLLPLWLGCDGVSRDHFPTFSSFNRSYYPTKSGRPASLPKV